MIAVIEWDALLEVVWSSVLAGIGVTAAFGVAIVGVTRAVDLRRAGLGPEALMFGVVGAVALVFVGAAIVFGIVVMANK